MRHTAAIAAIALLAAIGAAGGCTNPSSPTPSVRTIARISGHPEWPPIMYRNGPVIDGAGAALVKRIFDDLGHLTMFPHAGTWDEVHARARSGELDVIVAAYKTAERETYLHYSDPYTTDPVALFVAAGRTFPFGESSDLVGRRGVAMVGDSYGQQFDDFAAANLQLTRVATASQAFDLLSAGQADYFLYSLYAGNHHLKRTGTAGGFESLPRFVSEELFYITIAKQSPFAVYLPEINAAIARYTADGTFDALIAEYSRR